MPTYQFKCPVCDALTEDLYRNRSCAEACPPVCHKCDEPMERKISTPMLNFGNWRPNPCEMNAEKEFTAAGGYD